MKFLIVGGYPPKKKQQHAGGQITATKLLVEYLQHNGYKFSIIDTSQNVFPKPRKIKRILKSVFDFLKLFFLLVFNRYTGAIIFCSSGLSFYEKSIYAGICRLFCVKSALMIRSGHFMNHVVKRGAQCSMSLALKMPNFIIAQGSTWKDFYKNYFSLTDKVRVVRNWINVDSSSNSIVKKDASVVKFLYAGWMVEKKGVVDLFNVAAKVIERYPNFHFYFVGGGELYNELKDRANSFFAENIHVLGWKDKEDLKNYYEMSDVFVLPSYAEGFPNVLLEAMDRSLPIIATNVGSIPDTVKHDINGYVLEPGNGEGLEDAILKLGTSAQLRRMFSTQSKNLLIDMHGRDKNCAELINLFLKKVDKYETNTPVTKNR